MTGAEALDRIQSAGIGLRHGLCEVHAHTVELTGKERYLVIRQKRHGKWHDVHIALWPDEKIVVLSVKGTVAK